MGCEASWLTFSKCREKSLKILYVYIYIYTYIYIHVFISYRDVETQGAEKEGEKASEQGPQSGAKQGPLQQGIFMIVSIAAIAMLSLGMGKSDTQEVSFQWFKTNLLAAGMVDKLEVLNKNTVRVYVKPSSARYYSVTDFILFLNGIGAGKHAQTCMEESQFFLLSNFTILQARYAVRVSILLIGKNVTA